MGEPGRIDRRAAERTHFSSPSYKTPKPPAKPKSDVEQLFYTMLGLIRRAGNFGKNFVSFMNGIVKDGWVKIDDDFCEKLAKMLQVPERFIKLANVLKLFGAGPSGLVRVAVAAKRLKELAPQIRMKMSTIGQGLVELFRASAIYFAKSAREDHPDFRITDHAKHHILPYKKALGYAYRLYVQNNKDKKNVSRAIIVINRLGKMTDAQIRGLKVTNPEIQDAITAYYMAQMDMVIYGRPNYDVDPKINYEDKAVRDAYLEVLCHYAKNGFIPFDKIGNFNQDNLLAWAKNHSHINLDANLSADAKEKAKGPASSQPLFST